MKLRIGNGTAVDGDRLEIEGSVVRLLGKGTGKGGVTGRKPLILAYHLFPGDKIRRCIEQGEEIYEINQ